MAKFKKILYMGLRATLNFLNFDTSKSKSWNVLETVLSHLKPAHSQAR